MSWEENLLFGSLRRLWEPGFLLSIEGKRMFSCINCKSDVYESVVDLGMHPIANNLLWEFDDQENLYRLRVGKCLSCGHYSTGNPLSADNIFSSSYPYRTNVNTGYLQQCRQWVESLTLKKDARIFEIGANDGSLLQIFRESGYSDVFGVDPAGIACSHSTIYKGFFGLEWSKHLSWPIDLIIANNVIGHVPDLEDFIRGMKKILSPKGKISIEIPDFSNVIKHLQFDTIYHEHYSYFTPLTIQKIFQSHEFFLTALEPIPSHGGSFRYTFEKTDRFPINLDFLELDYKGFQAEVEFALMARLSYLVDKIDNEFSLNKKIAAFGAAAKGITMLNCLGVKPWLVNFCVDETPEKIGKFLPGSRIPIYGIQSLYDYKPDYLLILPWNHEAEIREKTKFIEEWGGKHLCLSSRMPNS